MTILLGTTVHLLIVFIQSANHVAMAQFKLSRVTDECLVPDGLV